MDYRKNLDAYLQKIDEVIEKGTYKDNWLSLANHKVPDWYHNAKFGIFIHWGIYTVPAFHTEKYCMRMWWEDDVQMKSKGFKTVYDHHVETYGDPCEFTYKDFIPMFKAEKFDPKEWARIFKKTGARFVMPVAEHHDGFQMYESELSEWNSVEKGPCRDIVGELKQAVEAEDMVFTASSHRIEHQWFFAGARGKVPDSEIEYPNMYWPALATDKQFLRAETDELFMQDWLARSCEIVDKYRPKIMYFDWWTDIKVARPYTKKFVAYYYNRALEWGEEVAINMKNDSCLHTVVVKDMERGQLSETSPYFWQNDTCIAYNCWSYINGLRYKTPESILHDLIDVVSKNGSLLLNVAPKSDGTIPEEQLAILDTIGDWMQVNGEAIYDTIPWRWSCEGPTTIQEGQFLEASRSAYTEEDFRFTFKDNALYVVSMKWPVDGVVRIKSMGTRADGKFNAVIEKAEILGYGECQYVWSPEQMTIIAPEVKSDLPVCMKFTLD